MSDKKPTKTTVTVKTRKVPRPAVASANDPPEVDLSNPVPMGSLADGPIAPLWDLPDHPTNPTRIPVSVLTGTELSRNDPDGNGGFRKVDCGMLGPQATVNDIRLAFGPGAYVIKARVNGAHRLTRSLMVAPSEIQKAALPFAPITETASGLAIVTEGGPLVAYVSATAQMMVGIVREDCRAMLAQQREDHQNTMKLLTEFMGVLAQQSGAVEVRRSQELEISRSRARIEFLEKQIDTQRDELHEQELEKVGKKTGDMSTRDVIELVKSVAPEVMDKLPILGELVKGFLAPAAKPGIAIQETLGSVGGAQ